VTAGGKLSNRIARISNYIGSRWEMEEWTSVPIGLPWDRMSSLNMSLNNGRILGSGVFYAV
jgi:hypothetical protein